MAKNKLVDNVKERLQSQFDYLTEDDVERTYDMALANYLMIKYPSENARPTPDTLVYDFVNTQWIYERMVDIVSRAGGSNVTSYRENGMSWTYAGSNIDPNLVARIMPKAGIPR